MGYGRGMRKSKEPLAIENAELARKNRGLTAMVAALNVDIANIKANPVCGDSGSHIRRFSFRCDLPARHSGPHRRNHEPIWDAEEDLSFVSAEWDDESAREHVRGSWAAPITGSPRR